MNSRGSCGAVSWLSIVLGAALFSSSRTWAQVVYSVNALAYADVSLSTGSNFITSPFSRRNNSVSNLFPSMPNGSYLRVWEPTIQDFGPTNSFSTANGWSDPGATLFLPQGAVMWVPSPTQISFAGEVFQGAVTGRTYNAGVYVLGAIPRTGFFVCSSIDQCGPPQPPFGTVFCKWLRPQQRC